MTRSSVAFVAMLTGVFAFALPDRARADGPTANECIKASEDGLALYDLLEEQIVPIYYDRNEAGLPVEWLRRMKEAIATITPKFSSDRMVRDYTETAYASLLEKMAAPAGPV